MFEFSPGKFAEFLEVYSDNEWTTLKHKDIIDTGGIFPKLKNESPIEFLNKFIWYISMHGKEFPRLMIYTGKSNRYGNMWEYIDWSTINYLDILSGIGKTESFFEDSFWRLIIDDTIYIFYFINCGYGDIEVECKKITIKEYNHLLSI